MAPTNALKYTKINFIVQLSATCFGQTCGYVQGYKMQSLDAFKIENGSIKLPEPVQRYNHSHKNKQFKST